MLPIQVGSMISATSSTEPFSRAFWLQVASISSGQRRQNVRNVNGGRDDGRMDREDSYGTTCTGSLGPQVAALFTRANGVLCPFSPRAWS